MAAFYRSVFLLVATLLLLAIDSYAQQELVSASKHQELLNLSSILKQRFDVNHKQALIMAKKKGWPIFRIENDGTVVSLQRINSLGIPVYLKTFNNSAAAMATQTNFVQPEGSLGLNLSGSSTFMNGRLGIWDGGKIYAGHQEFNGKDLTMKDDASILSEHATHISGTLIALGINKPATGMSFGASGLVAFDFNNDASEMSGEAATLLVSNHSYGFPAGWDYNDFDKRWEWYGLPGDPEDYNFGYYDQTAQEFDKIVFNAPHYLVVKAAGNSRTNNGPAIGQEYFGYKSRSDGTFINKGPRLGGSVLISDNNAFDIIGTTSTAKNILTVGAVNPLPNGPGLAGDVQIANFSGWGPTDDGRIKPDICGMGVNVLSVGYANPENYITLSGTSMATSNVSGSVFLLQEYYAQKNDGVFMRAATLKGLVCQTALDAGNPGPDYVFGWGLLDMKKAAQLITDNGQNSLIKENSLAQGVVQSFEIIASGTGPLIVGISWTDPEAAVAAEGTLNDRTPKLVNDLDLRISESSDHFLPWVLDPAFPAVGAKKGDNVVDNMEQIYIADPVPGASYTIYISHKNNLSYGHQAYSLIVSGIGGRPYCLSSPNAALGSKLIRVKMAELDFTAADTCVGYVDHKAIPVRLEQGITYPFTISTGSCGMDADKIAKIFIDWNSNGSFEEDGEEVAISNIIPKNGTFSGTITVPLTVKSDDFTRMRIVLAETTHPAEVKACGNYERGQTQDFTVKFLKTTKDAGVVRILNPQAVGSCPEERQSVAVRIKNFGSKPITNIPIKTTIASSALEITLNDVYKGTLNPGKEADVYLTGTFKALGGEQYAIKSATFLDNDLVTANNEISTAILIGQSPVLNLPTVGVCTADSSYLLSGGGDGTIYWYKTATDTLPFAFGDTISTRQKPLNNQYFAGLNDFSGRVGPVNKNVFTEGGYNQFDPGIKITTKVPVIIEQARLYIGSPGILIFTVTNANGAIVSSVTLNVDATRSIPNQTADDPADQGRVYPLNLSFPVAGDYIINIAYEDGATIYRNNMGVNGYPFHIGDLFSINGNTAMENSEGLYYYLYDVKVKSIGCAALGRLAVTVKKPLITIDETGLSSNFDQGNQWYFENVLIWGAQGQAFKPTQGPGKYQVRIQQKEGCIARSDEIYFSPKEDQVKVSEVEWQAYPVPATTLLTISLEVPKIADITLSLVNVLGQTVLRQQQNNITGKYQTSLNVESLAEGIYVLRVKVGSKIYHRKITVRK